MFSKLIDRFDAWTTRREREKLSVLHWEPLIDELAPIIEDHSILLETRFDGFVTLESVQSGAVDAEIVALAVALVREDLEPWHTEAPAQAMAQKLSDHFGRPLPTLLSRQWQVFAGHYVRICN
jgi:hypothetical protein